MPKRLPTEVELDLGRYELRRSGRRVKLEKKPMELLIFLVSRKEQLVSRTDIVTKLWRSDLFIDTEPNINNIVRKIRSALGDNSEKPRFLETVVGKGYRFIGPVRVIDARFSQSHHERNASDEPDRERVNMRTERPSLAVRPLFLLGKIHDDQGVCLGFADALVSRLGNLQGVDVLPTSAMLSVPAQMTSSDVGSRLGVRFVIHGAIQESKSQWLLSLEMFDTHLQTSVLRRKCNLDVSRLSDLEDEIAKQIASALNRPLHPTDANRRPRYSKDPMAYAEFVHGYRLSSSSDPALLEEAAQHLSTAVTRDPGFSSPMPRSHSSVHLDILKSTQRASGSKRQSFTAVARWKWIPICQKGTSPTLFFFGDHLRISSISKPLPNCAARLPFKKSASCVQPLGNNSGAYRPVGPRSRNVRERSPLPARKSRQSQHRPGLCLES